jgi:RinA family phage transcriptional activator
MDIVVKKYLEKELFDYSKNRKKLEEIRSDIIDSSPTSDLGMPRSPNRAKEQLTNKVHRLMSNASIIRLEETINAIDRVVKRLNSPQKELYDRYYRHRQNKVCICIDMYISERTFYNYKDKIVDELAKELGYL